MRASLNWIKQYVKLPDISPEEMGLKLTMSTVEVEEVIDQVDLLKDIVVGKVTEVVKHPKADRLVVCRVDVKENDDLQIICGATNVVEGMLVAVAKVGSKVKWHGEGELITLESAKIRGIESNGMIAASDEIGLDRLFPAENEREILDLSAYSLKVGTPLAEALGLNDTILDIDNKSMTHRPDLWGQYGLAREFAAMYETKLKDIEFKNIPTAKGNKPVTVSIADNDGCPRFMAITIDGIQPKESPWWLRRDLESVGVKSVNTVVDVTNYVMMTLGQPMHAYDYETLADHAISVDRAKGGEKFEALNDETYELPEQALIIKDGKKIIGLAGIIGGTTTRITEKTKTIALEAAHFSASAIRKTSAAIGLRTDASSRFEKTLDRVLPEYALQLAVSLLLELHPEASVSSKLADIGGAGTKKVSITVSHEHIVSRLGMSELDERTSISILKRLGFTVTAKKGELQVGVPTWRQKDCRIAEDIIEEVGRLAGYDRIIAELPSAKILPPIKDAYGRVHREMQDILTKGFGYTEVYNYSFADPKWSDVLGLTTGRLKVKNSLTPDQRYLRNSLIPGLLATAESNTRWFDSFSLFEIGRVFVKKAGTYPKTADEKPDFLPRQPRAIAGIVLTKGSKKRDEVYFRVKGTVEQLCSEFGIPITVSETKNLPNATCAFEVKTHEKVIGHFGLFSEKVTSDTFSEYSLAWWELQLDIFSKFASFSRKYSPLPKYPSIDRDIAIVVDQQVAWEEIEKIAGNCSSLLQHIELFDVYVSPKLGQNKKSVAFRLTFSSDERTLESSEVDSIIAKLSKKLTSNLKATVR